VLAKGREVARSLNGAPTVRSGGAGQGEGSGSSPGMAGDGEGRNAADMAVVQGRRGAPVVVGGSGGVLEHKGDERKVRGMATWLERASEVTLTGRGGQTLVVVTILGEAAALWSPGWTRSKKGGAREVLRGRASEEGERKKWLAMVSAPF
jgi:hypothetical protein